MKDEIILLLSHCDEKRCFEVSGAEFKIIVKLIKHGLVFLLTTELIGLV